jgi:hypothetical protein
LGYYGVQGRGGTNDAEGWSSIDEGRWKEGRRQEGKRTRGQEAVVSGELKRSKRCHQQDAWESGKDGLGSNRELRRAV